MVYQTPGALTGTAHEPQALRHKEGRHSPCHSGMATKSRGTDR